MYNASIVI